MTTSVNKILSIMKKHLYFAMASLLICAATISALAQSGAKSPGVITGRVLTEAGTPLIDAQVSVRRVSEAAAASRRWRTDEAGNFRVENLKAGKHLVEVFAWGYLPQPGEAGKQFCQAGESLIFIMKKGGVITGKVTTTDGGVVIGARVKPIRVRDREGRSVQERVAGREVMTDDRGIYRLFGLESGSYLVVVQGGIYYGAANIISDEARIYYPSSLRATAAEVFLFDGQETAGIDIQYRNEKGRAISGSVSGLKGNDPYIQAEIKLVQMTTGAIENSANVSSTSTSRAFALYGVLDGEYYLIGETVGNVVDFDASLPQRIIVRGEDITGVQVRLQPLGSITGVAKVEAFTQSGKARLCKEKSAAKLSETIIALRREEKSNDQERFDSKLFLPAPQVPDEKNEFRITNLYAGLYRLESILPTEDWYVRSLTLPPVTRQTHDAMREGITLKFGEQVSGLTLTLAEGAAGLRGKVKPQKTGEELPHRLFVTLFPAEKDSFDDVARFADAKVQSDGSFALTNIAPGRYNILFNVTPAEATEESLIQKKWWSVEGRKMLREQAANYQLTIDLQPCQLINNYLLEFPTPLLK